MKYLLTIILLLVGAHIVFAQKSIQIIGLDIDKSVFSKRSYGGMYSNEE